MWVGVRASSIIWRSLALPYPAATGRKGSFQFQFITQRRFSSVSFRLGLNTSAAAQHNNLLLQGVIEDEFIAYLLGNKKATDLAHSVWKHVVHKGDTVVDATCGNGHDTLALLKLVAHVDESGSRMPKKGCVYGFDIQNQALRNTSLLIQQSNQRELVKLFPICHSNMEQVIPKGAPVRLVAFNLGYLPGGDKEITTMSDTTLVALEAAGRIVEPSGLISIVVYVGHPKGREEFEAVRVFASGLSSESWTCCQLQLLNRPLSPVPIFIFKR